VALTQAGTHLNMRLGLFARIERQRELSVPADRFDSNVSTPDDGPSVSSTSRLFSFALAYVTLYLHDTSRTASARPSRS
jgi:hypothetical protein